VLLLSYGRPGSSLTAPLQKAEDGRRHRPVLSTVWCSAGRTPALPARPPQCRPSSSRVRARYGWYGHHRRHGHHRCCCWSGGWHRWPRHWGWGWYGGVRYMLRATLFPISGTGLSSANRGKRRSLAGATLVTLGYPPTIFTLAEATRELKAQPSLSGAWRVL
jgi:hypothetical protein